MASSRSLLSDISLNSSSASHCDEIKQRLNRVIAMDLIQRLKVHNLE